MANTHQRKNIATGLTLPADHDPAMVHLVRGDYLYYHYGCDGLDDRGWGCGYRTLQTLCSWCQIQANSRSAREVPTLPDIQQCLVSIGDKPKSFCGSRDWIGSVEVGLVLDQLYDIPCKIVHISSGSILKDHIEDLCEHFHRHGSPIMMGGDCDGSSKGILGVCRGSQMDYLLILDPHYHGPDPDQATLIEHEMLQWRPVDSFMENSFYNLCLPQSNRLS